MEIKLITPEEYDILNEIYIKHKNLVLQNNGYEYLDKSKFTEAGQKAFDTVTAILKKSITGFDEFFSFKLTRSRHIQVRFDYNWNADIPDARLPFTGVGYLNLDTLLNGFTDKEIIKKTDE